MSELVPLEKAAEMLGMTTDQLNDMRLKNEIFGTRDGASWKFKIEEVQRFADDRNISLQGAAGGEGSEFLLDDDSLELSFGSADLSLASGSDVLADDEPAEGQSSPSDTGKLLADSAELQLSEDDLFDDEISLHDSGSLVDSSDLSSDFEDSDLVLEDSDSSEESALELQGADSGVSLGANDSGISLDEPFSLGGSDIDDLELPEEDDVIALEESAGDDSGGLLASDDNFDLTPMDDSGLDDSSGSQVIALEDSAIYADDSAPTMLGMEDSVDFDDGAPEMLNDDYGQLDPGATVAAVPEVSFSVWNVVSLAVCLILVSLLLMVSFDVVRNMWQPEGTVLTQSLADGFVWLFGFDA